MSNGDPSICEQVRSLLTNNSVLDSESEILNATKFVVKSGANRSAILVYNTGRMHVEGAASELKDWLLNAKASIESGSAAPGILLPAEIERFPQTLRDKVPDCDDVVVWFFQEAMRCYKGGSAAAAAFMLGAASEKAILILIETYGSRIGDETNRDKFFSRVNNRMISLKYEEFKRSYKSARPQPSALPLAQDLEQLLDGAFNFYRHTRNTVGHPQIIPDLDAGVVLANLGQFIVYVERIYLLMQFFKDNEMQV